jgi:hypothetical protein
MSSRGSTYKDVLNAPSQPKRPGTLATSSRRVTIERPRPQPRASQKFSKNGEAAFCSGVGGRWSLCDCPPGQEVTAASARRICDTSRDRALALVRIPALGYTPDRHPTVGAHAADRARGRPQPRCCALRPHGVGPSGLPVHSEAALTL